MKKFANRLLEIFKKGDMILLALCVASSVFGIVMIYAATYTEGNTRMIIIQTASLCAGILVYLGMTALDIDILAGQRTLLFLFNSIFIAMLLVWGIEGSTGNRSWLHFSFLPFNIQPAEVCKITYIIILAKTMSVHRNHVSSLRCVPVLTGHMLFIVAEIVFISKDMGVALIFVFIFLIMAYAGGVSEAERKEPSIVAQELREWILSFAENREERRQWGAMLTRTLALTGFSPNAFRTHQGDWRSTDADLLRALREAASDDWSRKEIPFEDAARTLPEAGDQVPFTTLWKFWRDPADSVLKANGIRIDDEEEDEEVPVVPSTGGLSFWKRIDEALRAFFSGESEDDVRRRWNLNPELGARGVREWALEEDLAIAAALFDCFDRAMKNTTGVDPMMISASLATIE